MAAESEALTAAPSPVERPVRIESNGHNLFGILHRPAAGSQETAVLFLSSGLQNRAGPHRIYLKAARHFCRLGLVCLRLDLPGTGDSDDEPLEANFDCHDPAHVPAPVDFLVGLGATRVVLLGLCAGARAAVKAAARDPRVDAVVAWSVPIISGSVDMPVSKNGAAYMGPEAALDQLRYWAPKLVDPQAWNSYLGSGKTLRQGWQMMQRALAGLLPRRFLPEAPRLQDFLSSLDSYVSSGRKLLFAFADGDKIPWGEFSVRFPEIVAGQVESCQHFIVPHSDHTFTPVSAARQVIATTGDWLSRHYLATSSTSSDSLRSPTRISRNA